MIWLFVALGGALGAMGRYGLTTHILPIPAKGFPWGTLTANILGSIAIAVCYFFIVEKQWLAAQWRPLLMTGFLGAFTTYSTFALESFLLWQQGQTLYALTYALSSLLGCILSVAATIYLLSQIFN